MTDELEDLKNAFEAATPTPDNTRKAENIALAEKNFASLQGSTDGARPTVQKGPMGRFLNGVNAMWTGLTTKGAMTASTALVAVGLVVILPQSGLMQDVGPIDLGPKPSVEAVPAEDETQLDNFPTVSEQADMALAEPTVEAEIILEEPMLNLLIVLI